MELQITGENQEYTGRLIHIREHAQNHRRFSAHVFFVWKIRIMKKIRTLFSMISRRNDSGESASVEETRIDSDLPAVDGLFPLKLAEGTLCPADIGKILVPEVFRAAEGKFGRNL